MGSIHRSGAPLAKAICEGVQQHMQEEGLPPKLVLLQNHGIIALGATSEAVLAITLMPEKAAAIFVGAAALGAVPSEWQASLSLHDRGRGNARWRPVRARGR